MTNMRIPLFDQTTATVTATEIVGVDVTAVRLRIQPVYEAEHITIGTSKKHPKDHADPRIGEGVALARALRAAQPTSTRPAPEPGSTKPTRPPSSGS
jgi:hypothetical protein